MKRVFLLLALVFVFSGCFSSRKVDLTIYSYKPEYTLTLEKIIESFKTNNKNINIKIEEVRNDAISVLDAALLRGDAPEIVMVPSYSVLNKYVEKGYLLDISNELFKERISASLLTGISYEDKLFGFPLDLSLFGVVYNRDVFDRNNVAIPGNKDRLLNICESLEKNGVKPFAASVKDFWTLGFIFAMGHSTIIGGNNKTWIDSMNSGIGSFKGERIKYVFDAFDTFKRYSGRNVLESTYVSQITEFTKGNASMMIQNLQSYNMVKSLTPDVNYGFFPLPFTENKEDTKVFCDVDNVLALNSKIDRYKKRSALLFLDYLSQDQQQKMLITQCNIASPFNISDRTDLDNFHQDLQDYIASDKITLWTFSEWTVAVFETSKSLLYDYLAGKRSRSEVIDTLDEVWRKTKSDK